LEITTDILLGLVEDAKQAPFVGDYEELNPDENLYLKYLWTLAKRIKPRLMVEYGTWKGLSALHLAEGNPEGKVITMENLSLAKKLGIPNPLRKDYIRPNITYLIQDCLTPNDLRNIELLFIDGMHGENVEHEYEFWLPKMASNGVILFDDIKYTKEIQVFWQRFTPSDGYYTRKGDKIDLLMLHTWESVGFGAVVLKPFEGEGGKISI